MGYHPDPKPYIKRRWMATGPNYLDGTGWSLCIHKGGECVRCVAEYVTQRDAYRAVRLNENDEFLNNPKRK